MPTELQRAEQKVETRSESLKKPLGLFDLVLTQILFVVGSSWVGAAAKLGQAHLFFWLLAILLFYIPQAAVVIYLSNRMPLEGGIYQWASSASTSSPDLSWPGISGCYRSRSSHSVECSSPPTSLTRSVLARRGCRTANGACRLSARHWSAASPGRVSAVCR